MFRLRLESGCKLPGEPVLELHHQPHVARKFNERWTNDERYHRFDTPRSSIASPKLPYSCPASLARALSVTHRTHRSSASNSAASQYTPSTISQQSKKASENTFCVTSTVTIFSTAVHLGIAEGVPGIDCFCALTVQRTSAVRN